MSINLLPGGSFLDALKLNKDNVLRRRRIIICLLAPVLVASVTLGSVLYASSIYAVKLLFALGFLCCAYIISSYLFGFKLRLNGSQTAELLTCTAASTVAPLLELLPFCDGISRRQITISLIRLLDSLTESDAYILTPEVRSRLHLILQSYDLDANADLLTAVIRALRVMNDESALGLIKFWSHVTPRSPTALRVKNEAQEFVTTNIARRNLADNSLLRSSIGGANTNGMLLKASTTPQSLGNDERLPPGWDSREQF